MIRGLFPFLPEPIPDPHFFVAESICPVIACTNSKGDVRGFWSPIVRAPTDGSSSASWL